MERVRIKNWILAARPKTLPAAIIPVIVGSAIAFSNESLKLTPALICLVFAVLIQIGTNFANDYFDWKQGADTKERTGPTRAVSSGLIRPNTMLCAALITLIVAFAAGLLLVKWGGLWLIGIGIASVVCAIAYTAKPIALSYRGLGDVFVIFFFGIIAVSVTGFVQIGYFPAESWPAGLAIGLLANNLLVINNYRDQESDARAGKRTLIVRFGPAFGEFLVLSSAIVSIVVVIVFWIVFGQWLVLLSLLAIPPLFGIYRRLPRALRREGFRNLLPKAAVSLVAYGLLFSTGLFLQPQIQKVILIL